MGDGDRDGSLYLVGLEANQSHVGKDVLDLPLESFRGLLSFANAAACDLMDLLEDCLLAVPEYLPLMELLLLLCLLLDTFLPLLLHLFLAPFSTLSKASQACFQFPLQSHLSLFFELLLELPYIAEILFQHLIRLLLEELRGDD